VPGNPRRRPIKPTASLSQNPPPPLGDFPRILRLHQKSQGGRRSWKKEGGTGGGGEAGGPLWSVASTPCWSRYSAVREKEEKGERGPALLRRRPVQLKAVADAWSRSRSRELPFTMEPEPDQPRATPYLFTSSSPPLHRAELPASSSPCCSPPRRNAKERGCCTRQMSLWKPWTAPPCFLCSRPFHAARSTTSSSRPERG
jgi:hypothetical protein